MIRNRNLERVDLSPGQPSTSAAGNSREAEASGSQQCFSLALIDPGEHVSGIAQQADVEEAILYPGKQFQEQKHH